MATYRSATKNPGAFIVVDGSTQRPLDPRLDLQNHSPTGFAWGYNGSGPAQLALAILAHHFLTTSTLVVTALKKKEADARALALYQRFKAKALATAPSGVVFEISSEDVERIVGELEREEKGGPVYAGEGGSQESEARKRGGAGEPAVSLERRRRR